MNPRGGVALVLLFAVLSGCASASSSSSSNSGSAPRGSASPRVRCLSDPARDDASGTRPLLYFLCVESP
jgi:uncharacterized protein YceK